MPWPCKQFGTKQFPVHKSHLNELTGEYGCPRRFRYQRDAEHAELVGDAPSRDASSRVNAHLACGTAAHEVIASALNNADVRDHLLCVPGKHMLTLGTAELLTAVVKRAFDRELAAAAAGREIDWGKESVDKMLDARVAMVTGVLGTLCKYVARVLAVEPGFIVELEGVWYSGHIDLIFQPIESPPDAVGIADWKSAASKPDPIELAHGWEAGIYSLACERGLFLPRECVSVEHTRKGWVGRVDMSDAAAVSVLRPTRWQAERDALEAALIELAKGRTHPQAFAYGTYPSRVYHVHAHDFVPYEKASTKTVKRPEDLAHYGLTAETKIKTAAGQFRGPGWLPVELHPNDVGRLAYRARNVIGTVRMGRFVDLVREHCRRCPFAKDCLTGGYSARGDELATLESSLKQAGL